jgi:hypothetical protein
VNSYNAFTLDINQCRAGISAQRGAVVGKRVDVLAKGKRLVKTHKPTRLHPLLVEYGTEDLDLLQNLLRGASGIKRSGQMQDLMSEIAARVPDSRLSLYTLLGRELAIRSGIRHPELLVRLTQIFGLAPQAEGAAASNLFSALRDWNHETGVLTRYGVLVPPETEEAEDAHAAASQMLESLVRNLKLLFDREGGLPLKVCQAIVACFDQQVQNRSDQMLYEELETEEQPAVTSAIPEPTTDSAFVCASGEWMRSACAGEPFYKEHQGKRYCVLHSPENEKSSAFKEVLKRKLDREDFNFKGVWFPDELSFSDFSFSMKADFGDAIFNGMTSFAQVTFKAEADFSKATFNAMAYFGRGSFSATADFSAARFNAMAYFSEAAFGAGVADFGSAIFSSEADFSGAAFNAEANFRWASFKDQTSFRGTAFNELANFRDATFNAKTDFMWGTFASKANFIGATFVDYVSFAGYEENPLFSERSSLDLQFARIEKPNRVSFRTLTLRPLWFVNVDARKIDFADVHWDWRARDEEVKDLKGRTTSSPQRLLAVVYQQLALNAEENHRYNEASNFRYMAMDTRRREHWRGFAFWRLSWWYWLSSGYGERPSRATLALVGLWLLFGVIFFNGQRSGGWWRPSPPPSQETTLTMSGRGNVEETSRQDFREAIIYSAGVMTLQKPEPLPANKSAKTFVLLETILGPLQAVLLGLAIRRKFKR